MGSTQRVKAFDEDEVEGRGVFGIPQRLHSDGLNAGQGVLGAMIDLIEEKPQMLFGDLARGDVQGEAG